MNWLDIVILVLIAISTFLGLRIGIIKAALSLVGVIVGVVLAGRYYIPLSEQLSFISQSGVARTVAFAIILVGVMLLAAVLASVLKRAVSLVMLGWVNRLGGAIFGLAMGAIFCAAVLATWVGFLGAGETIIESVTTPVLLEYFPVVLALLPSEFDAVRSFFQ
ncbi:MAG TPA: colicin V production CvpA [Dehalococcoidia bacterium]|nr:colicin V production CvpA [Dehalococcoidia bacterium]